MGYFAHARLDAYQAAIDFLMRAQRVLARLAKGRGDLRDPLNRASISIVLNLAEGAAETQPLERRRFFRMSLRSAAEYADSQKTTRRPTAVMPEPESDVRTRSTTNDVRVRRTIPLPSCPAPRRTPSAGATLSE